MRFAKGLDTTGCVVAPRYRDLMVCLACGRWSPEPLCRACNETLAPAAERLLADGLLIRAPFRHEGTARSLVRSLKYRGLLAAAEYFAERMAPLLRPSAVAVVPVPRALARRLRYGVDPAAELAAAIGRRTGLPVVAALQAPVWWPRHAGRGRERRRGVSFVDRLPAPSGAVLVDDVATTGATLLAARAALKGLPTLAVTATSVGRVPAGEYPTHRAREVT